MKKLQLNKKTIASLSKDSLSNVKGGCPCNCTDVCEKPDTYGCPSEPLSQAPTFCDWTRPQGPAGCVR